MTELRLDGDLAKAITLIKWWVDTGYANAEIRLSDYEQKEYNDIWSLAEWSRNLFMRKAVEAGTVDFWDSNLERWLLHKHANHRYKEAIAHLAMALIAREIWRAWNED